MLGEAEDDGQDLRIPEFPIEPPPEIQVRGVESGHDVLNGDFPRFVIPRVDDDLCIGISTQKFIGDGSVVDVRHGAVL